MSRFIKSLAVASIFTSASFASAAAFTEDFEGTTGAPASWVLVNNSVAPLTRPAWFPSSGFLTAPVPISNTGVNSIASNFGRTSSTAATGGTISAWLISPEANWSNGDTVSFFTRSLGSFADRMQVRLSSTAAAAAVDVGATDATVGDFTNLLVDINPNLVATGVGSYPTAFTQFTLVVSGLTGSDVPGRLAFRYFVFDGGNNGNNSNAILLDTLNVTAIPEPTTLAVLAGAGALVLRRRRA